MALIPPSSVLMTCPYSLDWPIQLLLRVALNPHPEKLNVKGFFQIHSPVSVVNVSDNISVSQVKGNKKETEYGTTFEIS